MTLKERKEHPPPPAPGPVWSTGLPELFLEIARTAEEVQEGLARKKRSILAGDEGDTAPSTSASGAGAAGGEEGSGGRRSPVSWPRAAPAVFSKNRKIGSQSLCSVLQRFGAHSPEKELIL